jgi:hypothetical protein
MPEGLTPFKKYLPPKKFTSTTYVYEPFEETTYAPPPTLGGLPEYTSRAYDAPHNPAIPYREVEQPKEKPHQPYQHTFPKYTKYYAPTEYPTEYSKPAEYSPPVEYSKPAEYSAPPVETTEYSPPVESSSYGYKR